MSPESYTRKLTAIFSADVAGYSRLMGEDEAATVSTLTTYRKILSELIQQHRGRVIDSPGDNMLGEFASVVDAVQCAVAAQNEFKARNAELPDTRRMEFRIGVNLGDVIAEEGRIYGDGVNIAARLEALADPGGICVSKTAFDHIESKLPLGYEYLGEQEVKNISKPVGAYRVMLDPRITVAGEKGREPSAPLWRRKGVLAAFAAVLAIAVGLGIWKLYFWPSHPTSEPASVQETPHPLPDKPSIAVLPFENMSNDPEQEYFADGMTDELITALSKISGLLVISRNSSFSYKGKTAKVQEVAGDLNVKYVLEGSIQRAGDRVRIRAQLIDGATDHHLWAESYDAVMENIFDLQDTITQRIAAVLQVKLTVGERHRFASDRTKNIGAYDAFVKGWEHLHRGTPDDLVQAISFLEKAIELDPTYSRAHAALAWTYLSSSLRFKWKEFTSQYTRSRFMPLMARQHLGLAMRNPTSTAHLVASKMALNRRQYEESVTHGQLALAFDSNDPDANLNMAWVLMATGKAEKALEFVNKTMQLDPRNMADPLSAAGMVHFILGDLEEAARMTERAIDHNPSLVGRYEALSAIYALLGRDHDAQAAYDAGWRAWSYFETPTADVKTLMSSFPIKDLQVADRYAHGLAKAGWPGQPSGYYKIAEKNKLTGEGIQTLVLGREITVNEFGGTFWIDHRRDKTYMDRARVKEGNWWIEDDMICYQTTIAPDFHLTKEKDLNDCGEIFRDPDSVPGPKRQYFLVKDYCIAALTIEE